MGNNDGLIEFGIIFDEFGQVIHIQDSHRPNLIALSIEGEQLKKGMIHSWLNYDNIQELINNLLEAQDYLVDKEIFIEQQIEQIKKEKDQKIKLTEIEPFQEQTESLWFYFLSICMLTVGFANIIFSLFA